MACSFEYNGVLLSEQDMRQLEYRAIASLDMERGAIRMPKTLTRDGIIKTMVDNEIVNKTKFKGNIRIPRGRFASDRLQQKAINKLNRYNQILKELYSVDADIITTTPTAKGFNVEIHEERISKANRNIEELYNTPFTAEQIQQRMSEIVAMDNAIQGFESNDVKTDLKESESVNDKVNKMIMYKKSLKNILENRLAVINAELNSLTPADTNYDKLIKRRDEIKLRLYGKGSQEKLGTKYVTNLTDEIEELEKNQNIIDVALKTFQIEVERANELLSRLEKGDIRPEFLNDIIEVEMVMNIVAASMQRNEVLTPRSPENPFLTIATIRTLKHENLMELRTAKEQQKLKEQSEKLNHIINLADKEYSLYSRFERITNDLIEKVAMDDEKIRKVYEDSKLKSSELFKDREDLAGLDYLLTDGVTTTIRDLGPIPQLVKNLLEKKNTKYQSQKVQWREKLTELQKKLNPELSRLGYSIGILGEQNIKKNIFGVSYKLFRQQNEDGTPTNRLVSKFSAKYYDAEKYMKDYYRSQLNTRDSGRIKQANIRYRNFRRRNQVIVDIRKLITPELGLDRYNEFLLEDDGVRDMLKKHLGSDKAVDRVIQEAIEKAQAYHADYERFVNNILQEYGKTSVNDLDIDAIAEIDEFEALYNPFLAANMHTSNITEGLQVAGHPIEPTNRYTSFIPRRYQVTGNIKKMDNGEYGYDETTTETGYYDKNFETIENNDILYEFYELAKEIMETSMSWLPPQQQQQLADNAFLGVRKTMKEVMLDPDTPIIKKLGKSTRMIFDAMKDYFQVSRDSDQFFGSIDPYGRTILPSVRTQFINTNRSEINNRMSLNGGLFINALTSTTESGRPNMKALDYLRDKGKVVFKRSTVIPYRFLTPEAKSLIAQWMNIEDNELALRAKLNVDPEGNDYIPVGRILHKSVVSKLAADETFNMPKMLNLYMDGAATYAARNEALPLLNIIKNKYKEINHLYTVEGKGMKSTLKKSFQKLTGETIDIALLREKNRPKANKVMDMFFARNVEGNVHTQWGVINTDTAHLKSEEREMYKMAQKVIDEQMALPDNMRNMELVQRMMDLRDNLGKQFAVSAIVDRMLDVTRFTSLAINMKSAITNYVAGKVSNWLNASTGRYFSEDSLWRAERAVLGSHWKLAMEGMPWGLGKYGMTKGSMKASLLVSRFRIFQDASDEIYKSSVDTAVKYEKQANPYFLQQRTEYVNQAPVLIAMLLEKEITGKDGTVSNVWDAMNHDGTLKENFATEENKATWEKADSTEFDIFKSKVDTAIKNIHGDYTTMGAPVHSVNQLFRIFAMFGRWKIRYFHTRFANEYQDSELGTSFRGRFQSFTKASGLASGTILGLTMFGLSPAVVLAAGIGYGAGHYLNTKRNALDEKLISIDFAKKFVRYAAQIVGQAVTNPIKVPLNTLAGRSIFGKTKISKFLHEVNQHENEQFNNDLRANITEMSLMTSALLMRLIFLYIKNFDDDDEDKEKKDGELNYLINMCGEVHNDLYSFYNVFSLTSGVLNPATLRMGQNLGKLILAVDEYNEKYVYGPYKGKTKARYLIEKQLPSGFRSSFGFETAMSKVYKKYGLESAMEKQSDVNSKRTTQIRGDLRNQLLESFTKEMVTEAERDAEVQKILKQRNISKAKAKRLAEQHIKELGLKYINQYVNHMMPTSNAIIKNEINDMLVTIQEKNPDILTNEVKVRNEINDMVEDRIDQLESGIDYLRKNDQLENHFKSWLIQKQRLSE